MKKKTKIILVVAILTGGLVAVVGCLAVMALIYVSISAPLIMGAGNPDAGAWMDDPKNWSRAFEQDPPADVTVVHSYYWESDHFTLEYGYYFEVEASPEWQKEFLAGRNLERIAEGRSESLRSHNHSEDIPDWFVPGPVEQYEVWDRPPYFQGSAWIDKETGHLFFYEVQV